MSIVTRSYTVPAQGNPLTPVGAAGSRVPVYDGSRAARLPVEAKRSYNLNTSIGRIKKALIIFTILVVLIIIALIGFIVSCATVAANPASGAGIAICLLALIILGILLAIFYYRVYKTWKRFHRPSELKINSEVADYPIQKTNADKEGFTMPSMVRPAPVKEIHYYEDSNSPISVSSSRSVVISDVDEGGSSSRRPRVIKYV